VCERREIDSLLTERYERKGERERDRKRDSTLSNKPATDRNMLHHSVKERREKERPR
jgi:hypothetical protein